MTVDVPGRSAKPVVDTTAAKQSLDWLTCTFRINPLFAHKQLLD
ncbi:hypothetical protein [Mycolicibacterium novocastrense]|nr:hypothetical protein [Mycolicibacterium novocastrense]